MRNRTYLPRPEYPRPDRQRGYVHGVDWLNLNGPWEFRFDGERCGIQQRWYDADANAWPEQIIVPFCWESLAAWGEADARGNDNFFARRVFKNPLEVNGLNYRYAARYEVGWYRRTVVVPPTEAWQGKRVILTIGAADFFTEAWCNGVSLGRNEGGFLPFEFDLSDCLKPNAEGALEAHIVLRVEDPMDNHEQPVGKQWGWYCSASGIWQTVYLEPRANSYIERFECTSDLEKRQAHFRVFTRGGSRLKLEIESPDGSHLSREMPVEANQAELTVDIDPVLAWDPTHPQLYGLVLELEQEDCGNPADRVRSYFGMRSLSAMVVEDPMAPAALCLNGQAIYLRGALYQSYHAEGVYTAGDVQALKDDIIYAKRVGFDLLRIHIKIDDPLVLYYADTMGMLLMADFPNFGEGGDTPLGRRRFEEMMRGAIERDFNHPSIVAWCLFNETWGFGGQSEFVDLINPKPSNVPKVASAQGPAVKLANQSAYAWVETMWNLAKELDSTRLVEDMSVVAWEHLQYYGHGATDINSWHFYTDDYQKARKHIQEVVEETYAGSSFNYVPGFTQGTQPLMNSEYGGVGALDGDRDVSWSFKFLTNELRLHGKLSAYIYTELHDVEWERNGFLNYDRTPKDFGYEPMMVNQGDVLPIEAPPITRCQPSQQLAVKVFSSHFSRRRLEKVDLYWRLSGMDSLGWLYDDMASGSKPVDFTHLRVQLAEEIVLNFPAETMLCALWVRAMTPDGLLVARNYVQFFVDAGLSHRQRVNDRLVLRLEAHEWASDAWTVSGSTREAALSAGSCYGTGHGYFEWHFPLSPEELEGLTRIRILAEASSHREGTPQTDSFAQPTTLQVHLNGILIFQSVLPNHPHDARGALSCLRGATGAYGYLIKSTIEGEALREILAEVEASSGDGGQRILRLRFGVPESELGGLTVYGSQCGRYPIPLTLILG